MELVRVSAICPVYRNLVPLFVGVKSTGRETYQNEDPMPPILPYDACHKADALLTQVSLPSKISLLKFYAEHDRGIRT